jgi:ribosomal-protein-alanine N-acetyltransferase
VYAISNDPLVRRYLWDDGPVSQAAVAAVISRSSESFAEAGFGVFGVRRRGGDGRLIGYCGLLRVPDTAEVEIIYALLPHCWGRGLATEAARTCLRFGFEESGLERVVAGADPPNDASQRVISKLGMKSAGNINPAAPDIPYFALDRRDFLMGGAERQ